ESRHGLGRELHRRLSDATAAVAERLDITGNTVWVDKRTLAAVHGCERRYEADEAAGFPGWSAPLVKGSVVHRALQLAPFLSTPTPPLHVVNLAIERIIEDGDDRSPAGWLRDAPDADLAELRAEATEIVTKFEEGFPPLVAAWRPRIEASSRHELHGGAITLGAKPDLALGRAAGRQARVLIVDLKTGRAYSGHGDDLRFYALVETLRIGVPPFRIATYYLDTARWEAEDVTEATLEVALRRVTDGIIKLAELVLGERVATITPGPPCGYCVVRDECDGPAQWAITGADGNP
ncbi:MAG: PD-(D/E)XK nuclease family protein, partial [Actinobacteria bacterium]|nr:PD-(D/E)XK nuclease family protein [Actinomycetota bacterium]